MADVQEQDRWVPHTADDYADALVDLLPPGQAWPRHDDSTVIKVCKGLAGIFGDPVETLATLLLTLESDPRKSINLLPDWERNWGLPDRCVAEPLTIDDRHTALMQKYTFLGQQDRQFFIDMAAAIGYTIYITEYRPFMVGIDRCGDPRIDLSSFSVVGDTYVVDGHTLKDESNTPLSVAFLTGSGGENLVKSFKVDGGYSCLFMNFNDTDELDAKYYHCDYVVMTFDATGKRTHLSDVYTNPATSPYVGLPVELRPFIDYINPSGWLGDVTMRFYWSVHVDLARLTWFRVASGQVGVDPHLRIGIATDLECLIRRYKPAHTEVIFDYSGLANGGALAGTP